MKFILLILVGIYNAQDLFNDYKSKMISQINTMKYNSVVKV